MPINTNFAPDIPDDQFGQNLIASSTPQSPEDIGMEIPEVDDMNVLDWLKELGSAPFRGVAEGLEEIYDTADWLTGDILPDAPDGFGLAKSKTVAGGMISGVFQFATGFIPVFGAFGKLGRIAKLGNLAKRVASSSSAARLAGKTKKAAFINFSAEFGKSTAAGGLADFAVFDPQEARLSNLIQKFPALENPVTQFLAAGEDDSEVVGRLKNILEGAMLGGLIEPFIMGLRALRTARRMKKEGRDINQTVDAMFEETKAGDVAARGAGQTDEITSPLNDSLNSGNRTANERVPHRILDKAEREAQMEVDNITADRRDVPEGDRMSDEDYFFSNDPDSEIRIFDDEQLARYEKEQLAQEGTSRPEDDVVENLDHLDARDEVSREAEAGDATAEIRAEQEEALKLEADKKKKEGWTKVLRPQVKKALAVRSRKLSKVQQEETLKLADELEREGVPVGGDGTVTLFYVVPADTAKLIRGRRTAAGKPNPEIHKDEILAYPLFTTDPTTRPRVNRTDPSQRTGVITVTANLEYLKRVTGSGALMKGDTPVTDFLITKVDDRGVVGVTVQRRLTAKELQEQVANIPQARDMTPEQEALEAKLSSISNALNLADSNYDTVIKALAADGSKSKVIRELKGLKKASDAAREKAAAADLARRSEVAARDKADKKAKDEDLSQPIKAYDNAMRGLEENGVDLATASKAIQDRMRRMAEIADAHDGGDRLAKHLKATERSGRARMKEIHAEIQKLLTESASGTHLTAAQAARYQKLTREADSIRFDLIRPLDSNKILSPAERQSILSTEEVLVARNALTADKDVYMAIAEAASGTRLSAPTVLDGIVYGANKTVSAEKLYDTFAPIRDVLRQKHGETIRLYRATGTQVDKPTTNWASTREGALKYGSNIIEQDVPIDDILAVNVGISGNYEEFIVSPRGTTSANLAPKGTQTPEDIRIEEIHDDLRERQAEEGHLPDGGPDDATGAGGGDQWADRAATVPDVFDSRKGYGAVPDNVGVEYHGFRLFLTASEFRKLVPKGVSMPKSKAFIEEKLRSGEKIGQPFLRVDWNAKTKNWDVLGHEGRSRSDAFQAVHGELPMEVHIFPTESSMRAVSEAIGGPWKDQKFPAEMRRANFVGQDGKGSLEFSSEMADPKEKFAGGGGRGADDGGTGGGDGGTGRGGDEGPPPDEPTPRDENLDYESDEGRTPETDPLTMGDKTILNWQRMTAKAGIASKHHINAMPQAVRDEVVGPRQLSQVEVRRMAIDHASHLKDLGIEPFSEEFLGELNLSGQLRELIARQNYVRGLYQDYSEMTFDLFTAANTAGAKDMDHWAFEIVSHQADALLVIVKQNQEMFGAGLGHQKIVPDRMTTNVELLDSLNVIKDPKAMEEYVRKLGGGDIELGKQMMAARRKRYEAAIKANNGNKTAGAKFLADNPSFTQGFIEYWMNGILSGPVTHAVNATSNAFNMFALVGEKLAGGIWTMDKAEIRQGISIFTYIFEQAKDALKASAIAFKSEEDILDPMFRTVEYGSNTKKDIPQRALRSVNSPMLDYLGQALNLPTRLLLTSDVFFRTLNYRAMAKAALTEEALKNKLGMRWVAEEFDRLVSDGMFYSYKNVHDKATKLATEAATREGITEPSERVKFMSDFVTTYKTSPNTKYDDSLGLIAEKAIQYAREATCREGGEFHSCAPQQTL
jgi:hypothetical protein